MIVLLKKLHFKVLFEVFIWWCIQRKITIFDTLDLVVGGTEEVQILKNNWDFLFNKIFCLANILLWKEIF